MYLARLRRARARVILALLIVVACDKPLSTAPRQQNKSVPPSPVSPSGPSEGGVFSTNARVVDPEQFPLLSSSDELSAGRYRYRISGTAVPPSIERDNFLVTRADTPVVRLVLSSERVGDEIVLETAVARWNDVINSGTYGITMPLSPGEGPATTFAGLSLAPFTGQTPAMPLPVLEKSFGRTDVCQWVADVLALLPGDHPPQLCGKEHDFEVGSGVTVHVAGNIDSILILDGNIKATGDMDIGMTVDAGGLTGGRAPVFFPCNQANYLGCLTTPTGAALIDWLRRYVPAIPDGSLPPLRVCIPGTPVRTKAGYWDRSGFIPIWILPVFKQCTVSDLGALPFVVLPSFSEATSHVRPHVTGDMTFKVKGDGQLGLKIGIPSLSASAAYVVTNDFKAKASVGLFIEFNVWLKNGGATFKVSFDHQGVATLHFLESSGWDGTYDATKKEKNLQVLALDNPDSVVFRFSIPVEAKAELCIAIVSCEEEKKKLVAPPPGGVTQANGITDIAVGAEAHIAVSEFLEATYTRVPLNPSIPLNDTYKISVDGAYDFQIGAKVKIPFTGFILPQVPREWADTVECCRVPIEDIWAVGSLRVLTTTTGSSPDTDGYDVRVVRFDTLPRIIRSGVTQRIGPARDFGTPQQMSVPPNDSVMFQPSGGCAAIYSDVLIFQAPLWGLVVGGLRALGVNIPTYAIAYPCEMLVARYLVTLTGVSENCAVTNGPVRDIYLQAANLSLGIPGLLRIGYNVVCNGTSLLGNLAITAKAAPAATARDYEIKINGTSWGFISPGTTKTLTGLNTGARTVELIGGPTNCVAISPVQITIVAGQTATYNPSPPCTAADVAPKKGDVTVTAPTTGTGTDVDGYDLKLDGVSRAPVKATGSAVVSGVPPLVQSVAHLSGIAGNCRAATPASFTLNATADPITIPIAVTCTSEKIDTVSGVIERGAVGVSAVSVRLDSTGVVRDVTGPLRAELAQLDGSPVRVWGVLRGVSFEAYGYELVSTVLDPRFTGIVVVRGADVWLFGDDARKLIDAPAALKASAGAMVWVGGTIETGGVRPTMFGVIRSAP